MDYDPGLEVVDWVTLQQMLSKLYAVVANFAYDYELPLRIIFILLGLFALLWQAKVIQKARKKVYRIARGKQMTRKQYQKQQKLIQSDAIFNALDKLVEQGKSLPGDIDKTMRGIHNLFDMPDLVPLKPLDVSGMTAEERDLLESILRSKYELRRLLLRRKKANIPGPKPGEDAYQKVVTLDVTRSKLGDGTRRRRTHP